MKTKLNIIVWTTCVFFLLAFGVLPVVSQSKTNENPTDTSKWKLVFSDEFDATAINDKTWHYSEGAGGWGNNELQKYTNLPENAYLENGALVIQALKVGDGYTSARINTRFSYNFTYGRVESRMKLPVTQSIWPSLWMMGDTEGRIWPASGEIDIIETIGSKPRTIHGTAHGRGFSGPNGKQGTYISPTSLTDNWHVLAIEWEADEIRWYADGVNYHTLNKKDIPKGSRWPFDHDFYLIINMAVGGGWPGNPDASSVFPQKFIVDYVRIYEKN